MSLFVDLNTLGIMELAKLNFADCVNLKRLNNTSVSVCNQSNSLKVKICCPRGLERFKFNTVLNIFITSIIYNNEIY